MSYRRYLVMLLSVLMVLTAAAQGFNPDSPAEPGTQYRIKVQASPKEAGTVSGGGWYVSGKKATLKSSPTSAAWRFVNWTDNEGTVANGELIIHHDGYIMNGTEWMSENTGKWVEYTIPLKYHDMDVMPTHIIISCAASQCLPYGKGNVA